MVFPLMTDPSGGVIFLSDIFREVDEEVRQDQTKALWDKYGKFAIVLAFLVVATVGGFKAYEYYTLKQLEQAGSDYFKSLTLVEAGKDGEALDAFKALAKNGSSGFAILAKFQEAGLSAKADKKSDAVALYDELADTSSLDGSLRELARIRAALLLSDTASFTDIESRIGEMAQATSTWRHSAKEILAITAFRTGDIVRADKLFNELNVDLSAPSAMRTRAAAMVSIITPKLPDTGAKKQEPKPNAQ